MKRITVSLMRDLEKQVREEKISYSRMVEIINEQFGILPGSQLQNDNKPMGEKPFTAEEILENTLGHDEYKTTDGRWFCEENCFLCRKINTLEKAMNQYAAQQTQSLREENERLRAELDSLQKKHDLFCEVFDERAAKDNARMAEVNRLNAKVKELEEQTQSLREENERLRGEIQTLTNKQ
jgi:outer membrane murein-binding lipoprotein Lpp